MNTEKNEFRKWYKIMHNDINPPVFPPSYRIFMLHEYYKL